MVCPLINLVGYEHWEDVVGCGVSRQWQTHTHTQCPPWSTVVGGAGNSTHTQRYLHTHTHTGWMEPQAMIGSHIDTCRRGLPLLRILGYEHRKDAVRCGGSRQWQTHTHTPTVSLVIHSVDGASGKDQSQT